jgi:Protein of unknown function (DUF1573)
LVLWSSISVGQDPASTATNKGVDGDTPKTFGSEIKPSEPTTKLVQLKKFGESSSLVGEIDLGHIPSGAPVEVIFQLENSGSRPIQIRGVNTSCTCTKVILPQLDLAEGEMANETGRISIKSPKSRGQVILGTVQLLESIDLPAVAIITIKAYVERPYSLGSSYVSMGLDGEGIVNVPIDVDPRIDVKDIMIRVNHPSGKCILERHPKNRLAILRLTGNREELIAAKRVIVDLSYQNAKENWDLRDSLTIELFDSLSCRVVPSIPKIVNGKISFRLFRKDDFNIQKLKCVSTNCVFDCSFSKKSDKIISVDGRVSSVLDEPKIEISDGSFSITIPLVPN